MLAKSQFPRTNRIGKSGITAARSSKIPLAVSKVKQKVRVALLQTRKLIQGMKVAVRVRDHNDAQGHILLFVCRGKTSRSPGNAKLVLQNAQALSVKQRDEADYRKLLLNAFDNVDDSRIIRTKNA